MSCSKGKSAEAEPVEKEQRREGYVLGRGGHVLLCGEIGQVSVDLTDLQLSPRALAVETGEEYGIDTTFGESKCHVRGMWWAPLMRYAIAVYRYEASIRWLTCLRRIARRTSLRKEEDSGE